MGQIMIVPGPRSFLPSLLPSLPPSLPPSPPTLSGPKQYSLKESCTNFFLSTFGPLKISISLAKNSSGGREGGRGEVGPGLEGRKEGRKEEGREGGREGGVLTPELEVVLDGDLLWPLEAGEGPRACLQEGGREEGKEG